MLLKPSSSGISCRGGGQAGRGGGEPSELSTSGLTSLSGELVRNGDEKSGFLRENDVSLEGVKERVLLLGTFSVLAGAKVEERGLDRSLFLPVTGVTVARENGEVLLAVIGGLAVGSELLVRGAATFAPVGVLWNSSDAFADSLLARFCRIFLRRSLKEPITIFVASFGLLLALLGLGVLTRGKPLVDPPDEVFLL